MREDAITLYSFGYWGWGTSTNYLIQAFDALEQSRGFNPPVLVDVRISRSVRAPGFNNGALERLVGRERYVHMPELGNLAVIENTGENVTIKDPAAAGSLLNRAISERSRGRRIVFFCACPYQMEDGNPLCHRYEVGSLLLKQSQERNQPIAVTEWPGTEPQLITLTVSSEVLKKLRRGMKSIPIPRELPLDQIASITWGSVVHCSSDGEPFSARVNRAMWRPSGWYLPVIHLLTNNDSVASRSEMRDWGFIERRS